MPKAKSKSIGTSELLLIEPNIHHQELLTTSLFNSPYKDRFTYYRAPNIEDAIKVLQTRPFDLVLTSDFNQSPQPGCWIELLKELYPHRPIVLLTTASDPILLKKFADFGISDVLVKSQENLHLLPELIFRHLGSSRPAAAVDLPKPTLINNQRFKVKRILNRLNKLSDLSVNPTYPLKSIRHDLVNLTKMLKDLL